MTFLMQSYGVKPKRTVGARRRTRGAVRCDRRRSLRFVTLLALIFSLGGCGAKPSSRKATGTRSPTDRILVIIVPGTFGNAAFWPVPLPDRVTFGSQLRDALGAGSEVYPFVWGSSLANESRIKAAQSLASLIDRKSSQFDRVCLVGHSQGGNVALLAAGRCETKIDVVVCLSTPHLYLTTRDAGGRNLFLPVYCSPVAWANINAIISLRAQQDLVLDTWANLVPVGLDDNEASELAQPWLETTNHPRLIHDGPLDRLLKKNNLLASGHLLIAQENLVIPTLATDVLHEKSHYTIHSRRMGQLLGGLLRNWPTSERLQDIGRVVQPKDADNGDPVSPADNQAWVARHADQLKHVGWLLRQATITLDDQVLQRTGVMHDGTDHNLRLWIGSSDGGTRWARSESKSRTRSATWEPLFFVEEGVGFAFGVENEHFLLPPIALGTRLLKASDHLPKEVAFDTADRIYWSGTFTWEPVHY